MIDPDIELRLRAYNRGKAIPLTYEQYALMLCKQMADNDKSYNKRSADLGFSTGKRTKTRRERM